MQIEDIVWIDYLIEKLWRKHKVTTTEVEQALSHSPKIRFIEKGDVKGEDIYSAMGQTNAGRYLIIFL